jgi:mRNA-degrading endonuclease RelE of RelBE toxin-antitoxin system
MRCRFEFSRDAEKQLSRFPRDVQERLARTIDDLESRDDSQWSNVKALRDSLEGATAEESLVL